MFHRRLAAGKVGHVDKAAYDVTYCFQEKSGCGNDRATSVSSSILRRVLEEPMAGLSRDMWKNFY